jgi:hypothetical protein
MYREVKVKPGHWGAGFEEILCCLFCAAGLPLRCVKPAYGHAVWMGNARYAEAIFCCRKKGMCPGNTCHHSVKRRA